MKYREIIPCLYMWKGQAVTGFGQKNIFAGGDLEQLAADYGNRGADSLLVFDFSSSDEEHDQAIGIMKKLARRAEVPLIGAGNVKRAEDVKKLLYAGCERAVLNFSKESNVELLEEVSKRFGKEKILVSVFQISEYEDHRELIEEYAGGILCLENLQETICRETKLPLILHTNSMGREEIFRVLKEEQAEGISGRYVSDPQVDLMELKRSLRGQGIPVNTFESSIAWEDFKLNGDGLIPVIVQDYRTDEVLMLAYMNREAFENTLATGRMTYWSRSRQELWVKGLTSGHFQYVKSLTLDCDNDTILARVSQVGAACHTGNRTCFFKELAAKPGRHTNPLKVFEDVYKVILDRKEHPKEGSYTNYLFDKGIDKILKKVGEECTEIVIAAKNPDKEEIKYEISDFLYHVMVLMAEKGVSWEDITDELARR